VLVVVSSSTGDGDVPDNGLKFLRFIRKKTNPTTLLSHLHFALLGMDLLLLPPPPSSSFSSTPPLLPPLWRERAARTELCLLLIALGDTNYSTFCGGGKKIHQKFLDLGATEFYPRALADDTTGYALPFDLPLAAPR